MEFSLHLINKKRGEILNRLQETGVKLHLKYFFNLKINFFKVWQVQRFKVLKKHLNSEDDQNLGPVKGPVVFDPRKSQEKASDFLFEKTV